MDDEQILFGPSELSRADYNGWVGAGENKLTSAALTDDDICAGITQTSENDKREKKGDCRRRNVCLNLPIRKSQIRCQPWYDLYIIEPKIFAFATSMKTILSV